VQDLICVGRVKNRAIENDFREVERLRRDYTYSLNRKLGAWRFNVLTSDFKIETACKKSGDFDDCRTNLSKMSMNHVQNLVPAG
jgi:hypothetical protein